MNASNWIKDRITTVERDRHLCDGRDFIDDEGISQRLATATPTLSFVRDILEKSLAIETLTLDETAALLNVKDPELRREMEDTALKVKLKVYDNRIVTFAPLYLSNKCVNGCLYCSFRKENALKRRVLTMNEIRREVQVLAGEIGHKRLIVVFGEHPESAVEYMCEAMEALYSVKIPGRKGGSQIRRANVNAAPMKVDELRLLKSAGIGTYQVFQETYDRRVYDRVHPKGTLKNDWRWRLYCMHRAFEAGVDDVGIGALFGLNADWRFEVMGLLSHSRELEKRYGVGPHTISFPRMVNAANAPLANAGSLVDDDAFRHLVTVLRLAVPHTGMILTCRENAEMRRRTIPLGITQTDASSKIGLGDYEKSGKSQEAERQQFILGDTRSLDEVVRELTLMGFITSFCTAGYRCHRTGEKIMKMLKSGREGQFCKLNAVITFREWLNDFASPTTKRLGEALIRKEMAEIDQISPERRLRQFKEYYKRTEDGERDLYF